MYLVMWIVNWHNLKMGYKKQMELIVKGRKERNHNKAKNYLINCCSKKYKFHSLEIVDYD